MGTDSKEVNTQTKVKHIFQIWPKVHWDQTKHISNMPTLCCYPPKLITLHPNTGKHGILTQYAIFRKQLCRRSVFLDSINQYTDFSNSKASPDVCSFSTVFSLGNTVISEMVLFSIIKAPFWISVTVFNALNQSGISETE